MYVRDHGRKEKNFKIRLTRSEFYKACKNLQPRDKEFTFYCQEGNTIKRQDTVTSVRNRGLQRGKRGIRTVSVS